MNDAGPKWAVVVGDVMTDVVVRLGGELAKESDTPSTIRFSPGGSASNQAVWMARGGLHVDLVGVVGADTQADASLSMLAAEGVTAHLRRTRQAGTGVVVSLVDRDGRRSMLTDRGANRWLDEAAPPDSLWQRGAHFHLSGYELFDERTRQAALDLARRAREAGMTRSVDPNSVGPLSEVGAAAFLSWTKGFDVCCANLDEARLLTGKDDPKDAATELSAHFKVAAVTLGSQGALVSSGRTSLGRRAVPARVVDSTGAGDAFTGSFIARWLKAGALEEALEEGLAAAKLAVETVGAVFTG